MVHFLSCRVSTVEVDFIQKNVLFFWILLNKLMCLHFFVQRKYHVGHFAEKVR